MQRTMSRLEISQRDRQTAEEGWGEEQSGEHCENVL